MRKLTKSAKKNKNYSDNFNFKNEEDYLKKKKM